MCVAVPGRVVSREERGELPMAQVESGGLRSEACLVYVPEARVGDWVLVHLGMALQRIDEEEALRHLALLAEFAEASGAGAVPPEDAGGLT
jgi:hydrogenase expression/formation protein HypC